MLTVRNYDLDIRYEKSHLLTAGKRYVVLGIRIYIPTRDNEHLD